MSNSSVSTDLKKIAYKVINSKRISEQEGILLFNCNDLSFLSLLSTYVRKQKNQSNTYYNKNIHIEPTNICVNNCRFCSYSRKKGEEGSWEYEIDEMLSKIEENINSGITEVHIVGGTHPDRDFNFYVELIERIKKSYPRIQIKAFTAVELDYMCKKSGIDIQAGLKILNEKGVVCLPGGGAEIFDAIIRRKICPEKINAERWLEIHKTAHNLGIPTNATMLYGHIENYSHRINHMSKLRNLQDETGGFHAFIPLKYRSKNNLLSKIGEIPILEDFKNYAVSRIFLDNFRHIKVYWPMLGKEQSKLTLSYGVDDIDGTIEDSTLIYSLAGSEEKHPSMTEHEMIEIIQNAGYKPIERDTLYNFIN
ncbi:MAG: aminofutalosine synthase MqnE [Bacteroidales bacterium]|nr:aminofutalosine synthase MqnE [Bacteroidales bacterium]